MLRFFSASVRSVNADRAVAECLDVAFPEGIPSDLRCILVNATMGHKLDRIAAAIRERLPGIQVLGASGSAVTGREGVGDSMNELAIMAVCGPPEECAIAAVEGIYGDNSYDRAHDLATRLRAQRPDLSIIYLLCPGIDINNEQVLRAFEAVFGEDILIFGGNSSDNMKGKVCYQYHDDIFSEHDAWAVGFADQTLRGVTRATHGFTAYGEPLTVTRAEGHKIYELDGKPAWSTFASRVAMPKNWADSLAVGALGEELSPELAEEYGNPHILRAILKHEGEVIFFPITVAEGTRLWSTMRDEALIFSEQRRAMIYLREQIGDAKPVAVFQTDCVARGRALFNKVAKDELVDVMQSVLAPDGDVPPWLGNYGFGEYARLGGRNTYHNYTTSLLVLYRT